MCRTLRQALVDEVIEWQREDPTKERAAAAFEVDRAYVQDFLREEADRCAALCRGDGRPPQSRPLRETETWRAYQAWRQARGPDGPITEATW